MITAWLGKNLLRSRHFVFVILVLSLIIVGNEKQVAAASCPEQEVGRVVERTLVVNSVKYARRHKELYLWDETTGLRSLGYVPHEARVATGDRVSIFGGYKYPKSDAEFDYQSYLKRKGICYLLDIRKWTLEQSSVSLLAQVDEYKSQLLSRIPKGSSPDSAALIVGLVLGEDHLFDDQQSDSFQKLGLTHLVAVSGANFSLVMSVIEKLLSRMSFFPRNAISLILGLLYFLLVGATNLPAFRAFSFVCLQKLQLVVGRRLLIGTTALLSFFVINALYQGAYADIGLQLSFLAWLVVNTLLRGLMSKLTAFPELLRAEFLAVGLGTMLLLPVSLLYFSEVNIFSIIANLLFVVVFGLYTFVSWAVVIFNLSIVADFASAIGDGLSRLIVYFSRYEFIISVDTPAGMILLALSCVATIYFIIGFLSKLAKHRNRYEYII